MTTPTWFPRVAPASSVWLCGVATEEFPRGGDSWRFSSSLKHLFSPRNSLKTLAEGEGFEPPVPFEYNGFQDRRLQPLGHPSDDSLLGILRLYVRGATSVSGSVSVKLACRGSQIPWADDSIPPVDRLGLVAGELHGDRPRNAGLLEVADGRPAELVRDPPGTASLLASPSPRLVEAAPCDPRAALRPERTVLHLNEVEEHISCDQASLPPQPVGESPLVFEDLPELRSEGEHPAFVVLCRPRVEPDVVVSKNTNGL